MVFFFSLCIMSFSGQDIVLESTVTDGTTEWTNTVHILRHNDFSAAVFGWIFFMLALFSVFAAFIAFTQSAKDFKKHRANQEL